jgi:hypothetical protein
MNEPLKVTIHALPQNNKCVLSLKPAQLPITELYRYVCFSHNKYQLLQPVRTALPCAVTSVTKLLVFGTTKQ